MYEEKIMLMNIKNKATKVFPKIYTTGTGIPPNAMGKDDLLYVEPDNTILLNNFINDLDTMLTNVNRLYQEIGGRSSIKARFNKQIIS